MAVAPFGEWLPDQPPLNNPGTLLASGVLPNAQTGYGPINSLGSPLAATALNGPCIGAIGSYNQYGQQFQFAATASKIYALYATGSDWTDVTGTAFTTTTKYVRRFAQYNDLMLSTDGTNPMLSFQMGLGILGATFSSLTTSAYAPIAPHFICAIKQFAMVGYTYSANPTPGLPNLPNPYRLQWSAQGDPTNWPQPGSAAAQANQSDYNDLLGTQNDMMGLVSNLGNADGAVIFRDGIWRIIYEGPPTVFGFYPAVGEMGTQFPNSIVQNEGSIFYIGNDGVRAFDGVQSQRLGDGKVDRWLFNNITSNSALWYNVVGDIDPATKTIRWIFPSTASNGPCDTMLVYSYAFNKFSMAPINAEWCFRSAFGISADIAFFGTDHLMRQETGSPMAALIGTTESQPTPMRRSYIRATRPLIDGGAPQIRVDYRDQLNEAQTQGSFVGQNAAGYCPQRIDTRYARAVASIPAGEMWTHAEGVEFDAIPAGVR